MEYAECFTIIMGSTFFLVGNDSEILVYESAIFRGRNRKKKKKQKKNKTKKFVAARH